jgi:hypothetical protein
LAAFEAGADDPSSILGKPTSLALASTDLLSCVGLTQWSNVDIRRGAFILWLDYMVGGFVLKTLVFA